MIVSPTIQETTTMVPMKLVWYLM